jgi:hypothetical protein
MNAAAPNAKEQEALREIALNIAEQWGKRCGADCVKEWNETAGKAAGMTISIR